MNEPITIGREQGWIFRGEVGELFCFVPLHCVWIADDGTIRVDQLEYYRSGWSTRNVRLADPAHDGSHAFPDESRPPVDPADDDVRAFIRHAKALAALMVAS
jgi:hypothetical protein